MSEYLENNNTCISKNPYIEKVKTILNNKYKDKKPLAYVHTFGCQQNVVDGERIMGLLNMLGYELCDSTDNADIIVYNTCAVRENAEDKVFGTIGRLKTKKQAKKDLIICVCGCMTQQEHIAKKFKESYPYVNLVFGTSVLEKFPDNLYNILAGKNKRIYDLEINDKNIDEIISTLHDNTAMAGVSIMYGCNNFCTYCVVPYVRGRERSRKSEDILEEIKALVNTGVKEIMLLGQNVNSYGKGLSEKINFAGLLKKVNDLDGDFRIRFMSSHPKDATKELIDTMSECKKVCHHFHLPLQSGSDRILKAMNRNYTAEDYLKIVDYAREKIPDISFTTDLIVGFPGENENDINDTISLLQRVKFDTIYSFIYSKRVGTKAALIEDNTPYEVKSERFQRVLNLQKDIAREQAEKFIGKTCKVLVEGEAIRGNGYLFGKNEYFSVVEFKGDTSLIGKLVNIKIVKLQNLSLCGEII